MEGKKVKAKLTWFKDKEGFEGREEMTGRYLGISYYGSYGDEGIATETCLLVVDDLTGKVAEIACSDVTFLA